MRNRLLIGLLLLLPLVLPAQGKHALLVGISQYPNVAGDAARWADIHGANDVLLLSRTLNQQGFETTSLLNENATAKNIQSRINLLIKNTRNGDVVYIHFSCHGQPVEDKDGDEDDGWDESIVPYDAEMMYRKGIYEGENHILDDELNRIISQLSAKLGPSGKLMMVIDACHAGTSSRNDEYTEEMAPMRGTNMGFSETKFYRPKRAELPTQYILSSNVCSVILLEACLPTQRNVEIQVGEQFYGPLSYSVNQWLPKMKFSSLWVDSISSTMNSVIPSWCNQQMVVETNIK